MTGEYEGTIRIGINDMVKVRLNDKGRAIREERWSRLRALSEDNIPEAVQPVEAADGTTQWLLWEFMRVFGPHMHHGADMPFDGNLITLTRMR